VSFHQSLRLHVIGVGRSSEASGEAGETKQHASVADVEQILATTGDLPWKQAEPVEEGEEFRAESKQGDHASALAFEDTVVHGSVVAAV
jgi:hypothetical protein